MLQETHELHGTQGAATCFGTFVIHLYGASFGRSGRTITRFRTQKTAALLAYLCYHNSRTHTREFLVDMLWPNATLERGRQSLSMALSSLRAQLEPIPALEGTILCTDRYQIGIRADALSTDVSAFETLVKRAEYAAKNGNVALVHDCAAKAKNLYAVPLLPGFYEDWIASEQGRVDALRKRVEQLEAQVGGTTSQNPAAERTMRSQSTPGLATNRATGGVDRPSQNASITGSSFATASVSPAPPATLRGGESATNPREPALASTQTAKMHPLAMPRTRFFGREGELASLRSLLADAAVRLITLTGPGGVGKTRLSLSVAEAILQGDREIHSLFFVPLADITAEKGTQEILLTAILEAVDPRGEAPPPGLSAETLIQFLSTHRAPLLVLDNAEQIAPSIAELSETLLTQVPQLTLLVTSRQRLGAEGERIFPVAPLPLPGFFLENNTPNLSLTAPAAIPGTGLGVHETDGDAAASFEALRHSPAVALFIDRAQERRPDFRLTGQNARSVARLVIYLEGIPLALELAAAWSQVMTPAKMLSPKGGRFSLLKRGGAHSPGKQQSRHGSVWNALAWSYDLLPVRLQKAFALLSIFRGSWSVEAAEAVLTDLLNEKTSALGTFDVYDVLAQLMDASLIQAVETGEVEAGEMRFRMLETVREFAQERLSPDEKEAAATAHARYFLVFAEGQAALYAVQPGARVCRERLEADEDNLRTALDWAESTFQSEGSEIQMRLASALHAYWFARGRIAEGRVRLEKALRLRGNFPKLEPLLESALLNRAGVFAMMQGDGIRATQWYEESLALCRQQEDTRCIGAALNNLAILSCKRRDFDAGRRYYEESLGAWRTLGDERNAGVVLANLAGIANDSNDLERARLLLSESVKIARKLDGATALATRLRNLSEVYYKQNEYASAEAGYRESLVVTRDVHNATGASFALVGLGLTTVAQGDAERGLSLIQVAQNYLSDARIPLDHFPQSELERLGVLRREKERSDGEREGQSEAPLWVFIDRIIATENTNKLTTL